MSINESPAANTLIDAGILPDAADRAELFLRACKDGEDEIVKAFLDLGIDVNTRDPIQASTALLRAAEGGKPSVISLLIDRGADLELRDASDDTAFQTALNWSHPDAARLLAQRGADVEAPSKYGESTLAHNVREGKDENVALLLELNANPAFVRHGTCALRTAVDHDRQEHLRTFLDRVRQRGGSASFALDEHGVTPLHLAVRSRKAWAVDALLEAGAAVEVKDAYGNTPVDYALFVDDEETVQKLVQKGARQPGVPQRARAAVFAALRESDGVPAALAAMAGGDVSVDARNHEHKTALMIAAGRGDVQGVKLLLARGANPSLAAGTASALGDALEGGFPDVVALLLQAGAAPVVRVTDHEGTHDVVPGLSGAAWSGTPDHLQALAAVIDRCTPAQRKSAAFAGAARSAVMQTNVALTQLLCDKGVVLDARDDITDETALDGALASWHSHEIAVALVLGGVDVNAASKNGDTPLHKLCGYHSFNDEAHEPTLRFLFEKGARLDRVNWLGQTPWAAAGHNGARDAIARCVRDPALQVAPSWATLPAYLHVDDTAGLLAALDAGAAVDPPASETVESVLHAAIEKQDAALVKALIARGADTNRAEHYGTTPLMAAVGKDSTEIVDALLAAGADVNAKSGSIGVVDYALAKPDYLQKLLDRGARVDGRARSTMAWACGDKGDVACVRMLLKAGAVVDARDPYGRTGLMQAIAARREDIVRVLLDAGASVERGARDSGEIPATAAAKQGHVAILQMLVDKGASLEAKNRAGEDVLSLVMRRKALRTSFADLLAARGIDVSIPKAARLDASITDVSPAWAAVYRGDAAAVLAAIDDRTLTVNARDAWGVTPLMVAVLKRDASLVHALLERGADAELADANGAVAGDFMGFSRDDELHALLLAKAPKANETLHAMDRLNAQAALSMAFDDVNKAIERGEMKKVAALLAEKKAHPYLGRPLLLRALDADDEDLVTLLLDLGLSPVVGQGDEAPLAAALRSGKHDVAARLVAAGASVEDALVAAVASGEQEAVTWLFEHGAQVDARDARGRTPLMAAVRSWYSCADIASDLVARGADVNAFDADGKAALHVAVESWEQEAARFLLAHGALWDLVPAVPGAQSARALLEERGMEPTWPDEPSDTANGDAGAADDDDDDDDGAL